MDIFDYEIDRYIGGQRIAVVTFDCGRMNTISNRALEWLETLLGDLHAEHEADNLAGVIVRGNKFGLGSGADIDELANATDTQLAETVALGHKLFNAISSFPVPWIFLIDGYCLGGVFELALAGAGRVATAKAVMGFPEIRLNIFPGLGGTQRAPRLAGLGNVGMDILTGANISATDALTKHLVDAIVPDGEEALAFAKKFLIEDLPKLERPIPGDLLQGEELRPFAKAAIAKATGGRNHPRAPHVALDVMIEGCAGTLGDGLALEQEQFLGVATSHEGQAGFRFFLAKQEAEKPNPAWPKPRKIEKVCVAGADGFMGNAIAWLCEKSDRELVVYIPPAALEAMGMMLIQVQALVRAKLEEKWQFAVKRGSITADQVKQRIGAIVITDDIDIAGDVDLCIEALFESKAVKDAFWRAYGGACRKNTLCASNSSSMGPSTLVEAFAVSGIDRGNFLNLHFFSPAERPTSMLVEIVEGAATTPEALATAHDFVRSIGKTPVIVQDGSPGFWVNACLAAYLDTAEQLYREGASITEIDKAMCDIFPMGPFTVSDFAGNHIGGGMFDFMQSAGLYPDASPLVCKLRDLGRNGMAKRAGFYDYDADGKPTGEWGGLVDLVETRGSETFTPEEIRLSCLQAMYGRASELYDDGIIGDEKLGDAALVLSLGFASDLGGPFFYSDEIRDLEE